MATPGTYTLFTHHVGLYMIRSIFIGICALSHAILAGPTIASLALASPHARESIFIPRRCTTQPFASTTSPELFTCNSEKTYVPFTDLYAPHELAALLP